MSRPPMQLIPRAEIPAPAVAEAIERVHANARAMDAGAARPRTEQVPWTLTGVGCPFRKDDGALHLALIILRSDREPLAYASPVTVRQAAQRARLRALDAMGREAPAFAPINLGPVMTDFPGIEGPRQLGYLFDAGPILTSDLDRAEYLAWAGAQIASSSNGATVPTAPSVD